MAAPRVPILYVHHRPELGGAPQSLYYLLGTLDRERFEPHVFCPPGPSAELFRRAGAEVHTGAVAGFTHIWASTYAGRRWLLLLRELVKLPKHLIQLRRVLRRHDFALVHLNDSPLLPAAWLARAHRVPVVWHLRSALPEGGKDRRSRFIRRTIARYSAASIAINRNVAEAFGVGSATVPNSVELDRFRPGDADAAKERLGLSAETPVVAFFGFVYPSKGFREFILAAGLVRDRGLPGSFLIVGGAVRGDEFFDTLLGRTLRFFNLTRNHEHEAKALVAVLGLEDRVRFVPFTPDTVQLYQASDIVVAPSRGPELGRPVLEASACGCAIVASGSLDGGGVVVPGETGMLVPRRSPDTLGAALAHLLTNGEERARLGANARRHAEEHFDAETSSAQVVAIYDRVLGTAA